MIIKKSVLLASALFSILLASLVVGFFYQKNKQKPGTTTTIPETLNSPNSTITVVSNDQSGQGSPSPIAAILPTTVNIKPSPDPCLETLSSTAPCKVVLIVDQTKVAAQTKTDVELEVKKRIADLGYPNIISVSVTKSSIKVVVKTSFGQEKKTGQEIVQKSQGYILSYFVISDLDVQ